MKYELPIKICGALAVLAVLQSSTLLPAEACHCRPHSGIKRSSYHTKHRSSYRRRISTRVYNSPVIVERTVTQPVIVQRTVTRPVFVERTVTQPVYMGQVQVRPRHRGLIPKIYSLIFGG